MDETFYHVMNRYNTESIHVDAQIVPFRHHLEITLRIPPYPRHMPFLTPYQMAITLDQPQNNTVVATPGLTVFTSDARDPEHFQQCPRMATPYFEYMCTCFKSSDISCKLYVRLEWPFVGNWNMIETITTISYTWLED